MKHYLMVHDLVWINTTVTGSTVPFDYARLEAAIAAQYDYGPQGSDTQVVAQVLSAILFTSPFACGNRRTALVAVLALLHANGYAKKTSDTEAADLIRRAAAGDVDPVQAVEGLGEPAAGGIQPGATLRQLITHICNVHTEALNRLREGDE